MAVDPADLVTVAQVGEVMQILSVGTDARAPLIQSNITRASRAIQRYAEREFKPTMGTLTGNSYDGVGTRKFWYRGGGVLSLAPYELQAVTSVLLDNDGAAPSPTTLSADQYRLMPSPPEDGTYTQLQLRNVGPTRGDSSVDYRPMRSVDITGTWGMPTIPGDVAEACILTVAHWVRMFSNFYATQGAGDHADTDASGRYVIPTAAKMLLDQFRHRAA